jgi:hypothetical protein
MKRELLAQYPKLRRFDRLREGMGVTDDIRRLQDSAIELVAAHGGGEPAEKEASMICAALALDPGALFLVQTMLLDGGYGEAVEKMLEQLVSTPRGSFMPAMLAQANAAAGIAVFEGLAEAARKGEPLGGTPQEVLVKLKEAFVQDTELFAYMDAPVLLSRYEQTRDTLLTALEEKAAPAQKRPPRPGNGSFDF